MGGTIRFAAVLLAALLLAGGGRWYAYVTNSSSPYDEVGTALNGYMPAPLRGWGCGRLRASFPGANMPPLGCQRPDQPNSWRDV
ncbi:hypothetical protein [Roseomonas sp. USHLN139]|uniref:hypothetical protein n=1 Tax=Roseomonas sp. USHLN139 TaxID=3081298 RepID=UPI003B02104A